LAEKLMIYVLEEDKKTEYILFCMLVPKAALVVTADSILLNICKMLHNGSRTVAKIFYYK
ncbi:15548_t:CDS:2, partial [Cetraspora pellucida]